MAVGRVKWFNDEKGWGFIKQDAGPDVFVHYSQIQGDGRRRLFEDELVEFEIKEGPRGCRRSTSPAKRARRKRDGAASVSDRARRRHARRSGAEDQDAWGRGHELGHGIAAEGVVPRFAQASTRPHRGRRSRRR